MNELKITSTLDGSLQPSLFDCAVGDLLRPLLVGLHTWSADRFNQEEPLLPLATRYNWNLLLPEFRGPNLLSNPKGREACASRLALKDILDAVDFVRTHYSLNDDIFLYGGSGGGHASLMMAATAPQLWTAVSAWCPITDLTAWRLQNEAYRPHVEHCCGGQPEDGPEIAAEYQNRSPISHVNQIAQSHVFIHHGKDDRSVPFTHSLRLFLALTEQHPEAKVYLSIFDGGHDAFPDQACQWFTSILKSEDPQVQPLSG